MWTVRKVATKQRILRVLQRAGKLNAVLILDDERSQQSGKCEVGEAVYWKGEMLGKRTTVFNNDVNGGMTVRCMAEHASFCTVSVVTIFSGGAQPETAENLNLLERRSRTKLPIQVFYLFCRLMCVDIIKKGDLDNLRQLSSTLTFSNKNISVKIFNRIAVIIVSMRSFSFDKRTRQFICFFHDILDSHNPHIYHYHYLFCQFQSHLLINREHRNYLQTV